jgi:two-component system OmpR family response regulator
MSAPVSILVVDDEPNVREVLRFALEAEDCFVREAGNRTELFDIVENEQVDAITLDLSLGEDDGLMLAREIRTKRNVAIIMVTGRDAAGDRIAGLEHGADDYITKPFNIREIKLRIRNVLKRYKPISPDHDGAADKTGRYVFEAGTLDIAKREVTAQNGGAIELTDSEFDLMAVFLRHPQRILSRDELMKLLRGREWSPLDRTLDGYVARLRKKIEGPGNAPKLIKSVRGIGYVFTGEVHQSDASVARAASTVIIR